MEVILTKDVDALGGKNEVVRVKDGFARNYLYPNKLAIAANVGNLKSLKDKIRVANELRAKRIDAARELAEKLGKLHLAIVKKAGKEGKLFGSVTTQEIVDKIKQLSGIELDKRRLQVPAHLKSTGTYSLPCRLEVGVTAMVHLDVRSDEPAQPVAQVAPEADKVGEAATVPPPEAILEHQAVEAEAGETAQEKGKRSEADAQAVEDAEPRKKKRKKGVNEAEAALPE